MSYPLHLQRGANPNGKTPRTQSWRNALTRQLHRVLWQCGLAQGHEELPHK